MEKLECLRHLVELSVINNAVGKGFTCRLSSDFLCLLFGDSGFAWNHGPTEFIASLHSVWLKFIWSHYASLSSYQTPITTKHSSQMSGMRRGSTVAARAPISREFSKENGNTRNFKGKHKNQLLYCKIIEGIKFMTICKATWFWPPETHHLVITRFAHAQTFDCCVFLKLKNSIWTCFFDPRSLDVFCTDPC